MLTDEQIAEIQAKYGACNANALREAARMGASWAARLCYQRETECRANPATAHLATGYEDAGFAIGSALATAAPDTPPSDQSARP